VTVETHYPPADPDRLAAVLSRAAHFGNYFQAAADGPDLDLGVALASVCRRLGTTEVRVAASSLQYEFAERLWAVALGTWAFGRVVPDYTRLRCTGRPDGTLGLGFTELHGWNCVGAPAEAVAELLWHNVLPHLERFHYELRTQVKMADGLLWGNAATALVLSARSASRARSCTAVAVALLAEPPLANQLTGSLSVSMRRRSCCLYYRTAAGRKCGDCPL
jgi:FhuF 2Fe-2S C-terminal domain